ncbi:MAG TPA: hypothetical protein GX400_19715 [Chloroflexi bacterium]|nr:hypothetical protein [Chloroflexota bacterium]
MTTRRRYTVLFSILIEEGDPTGAFTGIGYAPTGGNEGLEAEIARQQAIHGWGEGVTPESLLTSGVINQWSARLPEEFGETVLSEPDPVVWSEHDTLLDALLEIQALFERAETADAPESAPPAQPGVLFMATKVTDPQESAQRLYAELQRQSEERRNRATGSSQ